MAKTMIAKDAVSASLAECFITIGDRRLNFMQLYSFESKVAIKTVEVPILGKTGKGNKAAGWTGTWKGTAHYNQSIFREMLLQYKKTGELPTFDIQVTNEDPQTEVGRQTVILKECLINGGILAKYDADTDILDEDIEGTFDDWDMPESFLLITGME